MLKKNKIKIMAVALIMLFAFYFYYSIENVQAASEEERFDILADAIVRSAVQCYAIEGFYPAELNYLEDNYYLRIDHDKYNIYYECFSSNIMPEFDVYEK